MMHHIHGVSHSGSMCNDKPVFSVLGESEKRLTLSMTDDKGNIIHQII